MLKNKNNLISFVEENVKKESQKNIFIYSKNGEFQKMTNNEFFEKVLKFSNILKKNKIKKGDRVIIFLPISVELYIVLAGLQVLGAIPVFLESWSKINHIKTSIKNAQPKGIISLSKLFEKYGLFFRNFELKMSIDEPKNKGKVLSFYKELENSKKDAFIETVSADDTALITYTTGSSGSPKGADRTHKFLKAQHFALNELFPYDKNDIDMPIFPVFALNNLAGGVTTVIPEIISSTNLSDKDIYKLTSQIKKLNINNLTLSPIIFNKLTSFSQKNNLIFPNIKRVLTGGAPISENDVFEFKKIVPNAKI
jgi:acyl-coenzyme A synthetase/AMP-(fatty) acid ligase